MPRTHPPYGAEFRQQKVELVRAGRNPAQLAREFRCSAQAIRDWARQAAAEAGKSRPGNDPVLTTAEREELTRLRRQVRKLQMGRAILAKQPTRLPSPRWTRYNMPVHWLRVGTAAASPLVAREAVSKLRPGELRSELWWHRASPRLER